MPTRLPSLRQPPIAFAHRGGQADAPGNTIEAFQRALDRGATGLEADVWLTRDGVPVLHHGGAVGRVRRRAIPTLDRAELRTEVPALADLYAACGTDFELSLDIKQVGAAGTDAALAVVAAARAAGAAAASRLWLCHHDLELLATWRQPEEGASVVGSDVHLVDSTRLRRLHEGPERRAARLAELGIDAINLHYTDWNGGLVTLFHRFGVHAFGWDAQFERVLANLLDIGVDAVYSDHVDRMMASLAAIS